MNTTLNEYVTRYYAQWLSYARHLCFTHGVAYNEVYDIFSTAMLDLLVKPAEKLNEMLELEMQGNQKLLYYMGQIIRNHVLEFKMQRYRRPAYAVEDSVLNRLAATTAYTADDALLECDESIYNSAREITAEFRDDSFIQPTMPVPIFNKWDVRVYTTTTYQAYTRKNGSKKVYPRIMGVVRCYEGRKFKSQSKTFPSRGEAQLWAHQRRAEILAGVSTL